MKKRISDSRIKYLMEQIDSGCSIGGDFDEYDAIEDLYEARQEVKRLKKLNRTEGKKL